MKGLRRLALLAILANGAICAPAWAVLVTIDPDDYAAGTNLSHAVAGVSLSTFSSLKKCCTLEKESRVCHHSL
jgi:hypothetical protein